MGGSSGVGEGVRLMEGIGLPATLERVKRNFWKTCTSGWVYW
jgi:hypothetical protein